MYSKKLPTPMLIPMRLVAHDQVHCHRLRNQQIKRRGPHGSFAYVIIVAPYGKPEGFWFPRKGIYIEI